MSSCAFHRKADRTAKVFSVICLAVFMVLEAGVPGFAYPGEHRADEFSAAVPPNSGHESGDIREPLPAYASSPEKSSVLIKLINLERTKEGVRALETDEALAEVAEQHAIDMIETHYFGHVSRTTGTLAARLRKAGIQFSKAGENLAGCTSVELAHDLLMASAPHKANILSPHYSKVGVAVVEGGPYGMMIVEVFLSEPETPSD